MCVCFGKHTYLKKKHNPFLSLEFPIFPTFLYHLPWNYIPLDLICIIYIMTLSAFFLSKTFLAESSWFFSLLNWFPPPPPPPFFFSIAHCRSLLFSLALTHSLSLSVSLSHLLSRMKQWSIFHEPPDLPGLAMHDLCLATSKFDNRHITLGETRQRLT